MTRIQSHETSNANTLAQYAALAALTLDQSVVNDRRAEFVARRKRMTALVRELPGWSCPEPEGAFYVFPRVSALFGRRLGEEVIGGSMDLSRLLLEREGVATVAGAAFGADDHLRLSYATSIDRIEEGMRRLARFTSMLA
jgi:aspartate aminotransferase